MYDTSYDFSGLTVVDSQGRAKPYGHDKFFEASDQEKQYNFYTKYYNFMETGTSIPNASATGNALLISDSYRGGIQHYIGLQYATTTISVHLHESKNHSKITERSRLDEVPGFAEAKDVYFVACPQNMAKLIKNCHDYFEKA